MHHPFQPGRVLHPFGETLCRYYLPEESVLVREPSAFHFLPAASGEFLPVIIHVSLPSVSWSSETEKCRTRHNISPIHLMLLPGAPNGSRARGDSPRHSPNARTEGTHATSGFQRSEVRRQRSALSTQQSMS